MASHEAPRFLLLLPPAPSPPSYAALRTAFGATLGQVLKEVATHSSECRTAAVLEVALACPELCGARHAPRSGLYHSIQALLAGVYKLTCLVAAQEGVNVEDADGVDVRVLTVAWSPDEARRDAGHSPHGPIVDLQTLATSGRQWQYAFGDESEAGEAMVKVFITAKGGGEEISHVHSGSGSTLDDSSIRTNAAPRADAIPEISSHGKNYHVAVGGTFDHIHIGHKLLLSMTIFAVDAPSEGLAERSATIGITGDQLLVNKKHAEVLESWEDRQQTVQTFIDSLLNFTSEPPFIQTRSDPGPNGKSVDSYYPDGLVVKCTEIQDPFGPTITEEQIAALIISAETRSGGKAVNDKRKENGWKELDVFEVDVLDADEGGEAKQGFESKISSTAIREKIARKAGKL